MKKGIFAMTLALTLGLAMINTGCGGAKTEGGDSTKKDTVAVAPTPAPVPADTMAHDTASHEGHTH